MEPLKTLVTPVSCLSFHSGSSCWSVCLSVSLSVCLFTSSILFCAVLIDEIHDHTHKTEGKVREQMRRVRKVHAKDTCKCSCGKEKFQLIVEPIYSLGD